MPTTTRDTAVLCLFCGGEDRGDRWDSCPKAPMRRHVAETFCLYCKADLERIGDLVVDATSGDDGGTYDHCEISPSRRHEVHDPNTPKFHPPHGTPVNYPEGP